MMKINLKQQEVRRNILKIDMAISEAINKVCEENDYNFTYAQINVALTKNLRRNLGEELKSSWSEENES